jgi:hypothetical protein
VTPLETALREICVDLTDAGASFALVGGLAVSARTEPRFTRDADIAVAVANDAEAENLIRGLQARGHHIEALVEQDAVGRLATVRLTRSHQPASPVIDLLFASSGIEAEVVADADVVELLPQLPIRVATTGHLIALRFSPATTSLVRRILVICEHSFGPRRRPTSPEREGPSR